MQCSLIEQEIIVYTQHSRKFKKNSIKTPHSRKIKTNKKFYTKDIKTPSHFVIEELVETMPTTTQQSFSPIHPTITTPQNKNTAFPRTTIQSTVKPSLASNYSKMDYQTFRPITKWRQKKQTKHKKEKVFFRP